MLMEAKDWAEAVTVTEDKKWKVLFIHLPQQLRRPAQDPRHFTTPFPETAFLQQLHAKCFRLLFTPVHKAMSVAACLPFVPMIYVHQQWAGSEQLHPGQHLHHTGQCQW